MFEINKDIVYVKGFINGAIYDFINEKVYAVNRTACEIIERYIKGRSADSDRNYLNMLEDKKLLSKEFNPHSFSIEYDKQNINLEMAWIEITQRCNLRCIHCYEGDTHSATLTSLSLEEWKNVIDQLVDMEINRLIIIGGEPCCSPVICQIIEYASKFSIDITLFTNATLITNEILNCIIRNNIRVKVSIYGHCASVHDGITGVSGSFEKTSSTVKKLVESGISVSSAFIVMKENEEYIEDTIAFVKNIGMKYVRYDVIRQVWGGIQSSHIPIKENVIKSIRFEKPNFSITKKDFINNALHNTCWYGKIAIMEDGNVIPCEFERNYIYGNVLEKSLREIIHSDDTLSKWFLNFSFIEECKDCEFRFACRDCRPLGLSVNGKMSTKNPRCCYDVYKGLWEYEKDKSDIQPINIASGEEDK